jgi:hypothetical protein
MAWEFYPSILHWPPLLDRDRRLVWALAAGTASGGRTISGAEPKARLDGGGVWIAGMGDVQVSSADQVRCWEALSAVLDGGATPVVMTCRRERFTPWPGSVTDPYEATHSDDAPFSDGSVYVSDVVLASVYEAAALRATTLKIAIAAGAALRGGEYFSIEHETFSHRMYKIGGVVEGSGYTELTIRPPLREAVAAGTRVEFDNPKCVMQLATPDAMDLPLDMRFHGQASPKFVESFPPWVGIS